VGTFSFGIIEALTGDMRMSVLAVDGFFCISLLFFVWLLILKKREKVKIAM
jgi:MFS-type transporter involved in bile tolerance (Atg22 family)